MSSLRVDNFVRQFCGKGDNFETFWEKFLVLANLQKWDTDVKKMQHLPLFLDGDVFLVFRRMSDADKKKPDAVKARLQEAFAVSRAQAYELFKTRTLRVDESIDAYAADLQRLLALSGHESAGDADKDPVVVFGRIAKRFFVSSSPVYRWWRGKRDELHRARACTAAIRVGSGPWRKRKLCSWCHAACCKRLSWREERVVLPLQGTGPHPSRLPAEGRQRRRQGEVSL